ncbi:Molybdopterin synthase catalytic subunit [Carnimonas sp. R-84981]|uniref:molybdenum cofactor biosynthesis protein MoaE n=1 Tax=Carnimonas bestiolae TaxID=3402172 RepID=UPI003EDBF2AB
MIYIAVQPEPFDAAQIEQQLLAERRDIGAVVSFSGRVRDFSEVSNVTALTLEHYPGMTEQALAELAEQARQRWSLSGVALVHRVGRLAAGDQIVLVMTLAAHRRDAFAGCEFLIDRLKTAAPFWKKEHLGDSERWVAERHGDIDASRRWEE